MARTPVRRSPLAMVVLAQLIEGPMHVYRMQQLIRERGKDTVVNVAQRNSVYQTVERLERAGLVEVAGTDRQPGRPERTVYRITPAGRETLREWLQTMLSTPAREFPEFPAALAFVPVLTPDTVARLLRHRVERLEQALVDLDRQRAAAAAVPRLFLLEDEYRANQLRAELEWVRRLVADLESGALTWDEAWIREVAAALEGTTATAGGAGADR
ncbi:MAG TPA: PadR family transcriptional regulator [Egibacteraceae bacterium]